MLFSKARVEEGTTYSTALDWSVSLHGVYLPAKESRLKLGQQVVLVPFLFAFASFRKNTSIASSKTASTFSPSLAEHST